MQCIKEQKNKNQFQTRSWQPKHKKPNNVEENSKKSKMK